MIPRSLSTGVLNAATLLCLCPSGAQSSTARWSAMSIPIALGADVAVADRLPSVIAGGTTAVEADAHGQRGWILILGSGERVATGAISRPEGIGVCVAVGSGSGGRFGGSVLRVLQVQESSSDGSRQYESESGYRTALALGWSGDGGTSIDVAAEASFLDRVSERTFSGDASFSRESNDDDPDWSARSLVRLPMLSGEGRAHLSWASHKASRTTRDYVGESRRHENDDGFSGIAEVGWVRPLERAGQAVFGIRMETRDQELRLFEPPHRELYQWRDRNLSWFAGVEGSPRSWLALRGGASQAHAWSWTRFRVADRAVHTATSVLADPVPTVGMGFRSRALEIDLELQPERAFEDVLAGLSIVARL